MTVPVSDGDVLGIGRHLRVVSAAPDETYLFAESGVTRLAGGGIASLVALLDGTRSMTDVLREAPPALGPDRVRAIVASLSGAGLVTPWATRPDGPPTADHIDAYWDAVGVTRPGPAGLALRAQPGVAGDAVREALAAAGLAPDENPAREENSAPDPGGLTIVLCADYLDPALGEIDAAHRATGRPWLPAVPVGVRIWVGPVFDPAEPGCWQCLARRLRRHRRAEDLAAAGSGGSVPARPEVATASTVGMAAHVLAQEAAKWLAGYRYEGQRAVWTFDTRTLQGEHHAKVVDPACAHCGSDPVAAPPSAPQLRSRPVVAGDYRAATAEDVLDRLVHLVSPVTGIVKRVEADPQSATGPAFRSGPNLGAPAWSLDGLLALNLRASGGKGSSAGQAKVSALCEALERHSGDFRPTDVRRRGSLRSLAGGAVDPRRCLLYSDEQYRDRLRINATCSPLHAVPEPFDPEAELDWSPLWSMTAGAARLLPTQLLYYGAPGSGGRSLRADSNGCAAGSCLEEALLYGLLEIIERDAVATWWYNRLVVPGVDLDSLGTAWIDDVRDRHAELGRAVWALDVTADSGVPVVVAFSRRIDGPAENITFGFGAHLDLERAVIGAVAELNQMLPTADGVSGSPRTADPEAERWRRATRLAEHPFLGPAPHALPRRRGDVGSLATRDLAADVELVRRRLERTGGEVLVLNQTRPEVGLPVVKVVVPGMRSLLPRFAPGRLFDVPVALGLRSTPIDAGDLNPTPMFL